MQKSRQGRGIYSDDNDRELLFCDSKIIAGMLYEKIKQASLLQIDILVELQNSFKTISFLFAHNIAEPKS